MRMKSSARMHRTNRPIPYRGFVLIVALSFVTAGLVAQEAAPSKKLAEDAGFTEFTVRVDQYLKLRKAVEKKLPSTKSKEELPEMIAAHQQALARKLREARPHARPGDIFTHNAGEAFRHVIRSVFQGSSRLDLVDLHGTRIAIESFAEDRHAPGSAVTVRPAAAVFALLDD